MRSDLHEVRGHRAVCGVFQPEGEGLAMCPVGAQRVDVE